MSVPALFIITACSSGASTQTPTTAQPSPPSKPAAPIIDIKDVAVLFDGNPIARLHADGRTESVGDGAPGPGATFTPGPTFRGDGTIELTKGGFKVRVEADGDIFIVPPPDSGEREQLYGRLTSDTVLSVGTRDSGVRLEGAKLVSFYESKPTSVIGVVEPPSMGRTALLMTAAFYIEMALTPR